MEDFATLVKPTYHKTWYDESIGFATQFSFMAEKVQMNISVMVKLRENLVDLNNEYLEKMGVLVTNPYKVPPYRPCCP